MWRFFLGLPADGARLGLAAVRWVAAPPRVRFGVFPGIHFALRSAVFGFLCAMFLGDWVRSILTNDMGMPPVGVCVLGLLLTSMFGVVLAAVSLVLSAGANEQWPRRGGD